MALTHNQSIGLANPVSASPGGARLFRDVLLALLALAGFCCTLELGFRALGKHLQASFYMPDKDLGHRFRPSVSGWNVAENQNFVQISSQGMHDREHTIERPPNVVRIAVIGDSMTEAEQVSLEQNYCAVLERDLNARMAPLGRRVEVLNFAVGGYGPAQEATVIEHGIWKFDPQIVIVANATEISVLRSTRKVDVSEHDRAAPFYILHDGQLILDDQSIREQASLPPESRFHRTSEWINRLELFGLFRDSARAAAQRISETKASLLSPLADAKTTTQLYAEWGQYANVVRLEQYVDRASTAHPDPDIDEAWKITEALFVKDRESAARHHAQLWLFTLDIAFQVEPDPNVRSAFIHRLGLHDTFAADRKLAKFASDAGIPHGILGPDIAAYAEQHNVLLHGFAGMPRNTGHFNRAGHGVVGHLMAQRLWDGCPLLHAHNQALSSSN